MTNSPWMTAKEAARYIKHSDKFLRREIRKGRLRAARVGERREILTRAEWLDEWVAENAKPVELPRRPSVLKLR